MDRISIEDSLRWLRSFLTREWPLAAPIALAFLGLPALVVNLATAQAMATLSISPPQTPAEWSALVSALPGWLWPLFGIAYLVMLAGGLALIALALLPQVSVAEAIRTALERLAAAIAATILIGVALMIVLQLIGALGLIGIPMGLLVLVTIPCMIAGSILQLLLLPLIVDRRTGPIAAIRTGPRFYRGNLLRLGASVILYMMVTVIAAFALQSTLGLIVLAIANGMGVGDVGRVVMTVIGSVVSAAQLGGLYLLIAAFYRTRIGRA